MYEPHDRCSEYIFYVSFCPGHRGFGQYQLQFLDLDRKFISITITIMMTLIYGIVFLPAPSHSH